MAQAARNPFRPGSGAKPPHLAGRVGTLAKFQECLADLRDKGAEPQGPMVLIAPRGQGKTVLLQRMRSLAVKRALKPRALLEPACRVMALLPSAVPTPDRLLDRMVHAHLGAGGVPVGTETTWKKGVKVPGIADAGASQTTIKVHLADGLVETLLRMGRSQPLVCLVDEAHRLKPDVGEALLNAEQSARTQGAKLLFVFAGTPDMEDRFRRMNATFWSRLSVRERRLGLLSEDDAAASIALPFAQPPRKAAIEDEAAQRIFDLTDGYPYFLQEMGHALWEQVQQHQRRIRPDDVERAVPDFTTSRNEYYIKRTDELAQVGLMGAAFAVAAAHRRAQHGLGIGLTRSHIVAACQAGRALCVDREGEQQYTGADMADRLEHAGFVWRAKRGGRHYSPGIPSLMDFVRDDVLERCKDAEARLLQSPAFKAVFDGAPEPEAPPLA